MIEDTITISNFEHVFIQFTLFEQKTTDWKTVKRASVTSGIKTKDTMVLFSEP